MQQDQLERFEGYSVAQKPDTEVWMVFCNGLCVARISRLGPMFGNVVAFEWHKHDMWGFSASDFVRVK